MYLKSVELRNFKNCNNVLVELSEGINFFLGPNAQGKTNFLESIYFCAIGRGFRNYQDKNLINYSKFNAKISVNVIDNSGENLIKVYLNRVGKKSIIINNAFASKIGELIGYLRCVLFSPDEMKLVKGAPIERRKFMDIALSQVDRKYFYSLLRFNKLIQHRNKLLKENPTENDLSIWDTQILQIAPYIILTRYNFIEEIAKVAKEKMYLLTDNKEKLDIKYYGIIAKDENEIIDIYIDQLQKTKKRDLMIGSTTIGPHKDDLIIKLNEIDVRTQCSQGQQRTVSLAIKLAEMLYFKKVTNEYPIFLLDDVLSELDLQRRQLLMKQLVLFQSIITATDIGTEIKSDYNYKMFCVNNGNFLERKVDI